MFCVRIKIEMLTWWWRNRNYRLQTYKLQVMDHGCITISGCRPAYEPKCFPIFPGPLPHCTAHCTYTLVFCPWPHPLGPIHCITMIFSLQYWEWPLMLKKVYPLESMIILCNFHGNMLLRFWPKSQAKENIYRGSKPLGTAFFYGCSGHHLSCRVMWCPDSKTTL